MGRLIWLAFVFSVPSFGIGLWAGFAAGLGLTLWVGLGGAFLFGAATTYLAAPGALAGETDWPLVLGAASAVFWLLFVLVGAFTAITLAVCLIG